VPLSLIIAPYILYVTISGAVLYCGVIILTGIFRLPPRAKMILYVSVLVVPVVTYAYYLRHMSEGCALVGQPDALRICSLAARFSDILAPLTAILLVGHVAWRLWQVATAPTAGLREMRDEKLRSKIDTLLQELTPSKKVKVVLMDSAYPLAFVRGLFKEELVVTRGMLELLDREELKAVLAHELAHIRGGDNLFNLVLWLRDLAFFSPFAHLAAKAYTEERELAADFAAETDGGRAHLADALLKVAQRGRSLAQFAWQGSSFASHLVLTRRIRALVSGREKYSRIPVSILLVLLSLTVLFLC